MDYSISRRLDGRKRETAQTCWLYSRTVKSCRPKGRKVVGDSSVHSASSSSQSKQMKTPCLGRSSSMRARIAAGSEVKEEKGLFLSIGCLTVF